MKALTDLKRRQISAALAPSPLPDGNSEYHPRLFGRPFRRQLRAVTALDLPAPSESIAIDDSERAMAPRDTRGVIASAKTNLVIRPTFNNNGKRMTTRLLTTEEFIQVSLATVRESTRHCYWPADVLAKFAAAEVIR
jgi:hypothetical protein